MAKLEIHEDLDERGDIVKSLERNPFDLKFFHGNEGNEKPRDSLVINFPLPSFNIS